MALTVRNTPDAKVNALVVAHNLFMREVTQQFTTNPHADITSTSAGNYQAPTSAPLLSVAAAATDLATTRTLARELYDVITPHLADAGTAVNAWGGAHKAADTANPLPAKLATTDVLSAIQTWLNAAKAAWNLHLAQAGVHFTDDTTNAVATADASDLTTAEALANAMQTAVNAHIQFAFTSPTLKIVAA